MWLLTVCLSNDNDKIHFIAYENFDILDNQHSAISKNGKYVQSVWFVQLFYQVFLAVNFTSMLFHL